jgi:integrase
MKHEERVIKLTKRAIDGIGPQLTTTNFWDEDIKGFGLKVTPAGRRSFFLYYRTADHTQRRPTIGTYPAVRPNQARAIAMDWLSQARAGRDPSGERKQLRALRGTGTVADLFSSYLKAKSSLRSIREIERLFNHDILPIIGQTRAESVTKADVTRLLDNVAKRSLSLAHAVRRQLSAFYTWALPRLPDAAVNPVKSATKVEPLPNRERLLSDDELSILWHVLAREPEPWRSALRLLLLTGQRREEVLQANWKEFDMAAALWIIPAERAKNKQVHLVPLSPAAITILNEIAPEAEREGRLFRTGTGPAGRAAKRIREAMDIPAWRWHDIRRTVATGMQRLGVRLEVTEAVLNHVSGSRSGIVGIYQRHDWAIEKRAALNAWARDVERIISSEVAQTNVIPLRA